MFLYLGEHLGATGAKKSKNKKREQVTGATQAVLFHTAM